MHILVNNNTIEKRCNKCNSILAIEINDISYDDITGRFDCICAACHACITINSKDIPPNWISTIVDEPY